jgi:hypothetical protein
MTNYDDKPNINVSTGSDGSTGIAIIIAAIVLVVGAFVFFNYGYGPASGPNVVQNNTTLPAPVIETPAASEATPPAAPQPTPAPAAPAANP